MKGSTPQNGHRAFEIIGTGFWNEAMPLVRYRTDDVVIVPDSDTPSDIEFHESGSRNGLRR
ncbi:MAG TPA: hypothetical protein VJA26_12090 [Gammaproteobacteria bacterium]|nr:hypothetical protein [Gammaproteobacteria bacterium]